MQLLTNSRQQPGQETGVNAYLNGVIRQTILTTVFFLIVYILGALWAGFFTGGIKFITQAWVIQLIMVLGAWIAGYFYSARNNGGIERIVEGEALAGIFGAAS